MNFLELCQNVARKGGISGSILSVSSQSGEALRVVGWVMDAYRYVLNKHTDWTFLRADVTFNTTASNANYTAAAAGVAEFGEWRFIDYWRSFPVAVGYAGEQPVKYVPYNTFRNAYLFGAQRATVGRPLVVTEKPDQSLLFWPTPDDAYTIIGEQHRCPANLLNNVDIPVFPAKFHEVIVQRALMFYGEYEGDAGVFTAAQTECARLVGEMESLYLPEWDAPEPMA